MTKNSSSPDLEAQSRADYIEKSRLRDEMQGYYDGKMDELKLGDVDLASVYLPGGERFFDRGILFAQRGIDTIVDAFTQGDDWAVVSGLNPSGPLHLGHKAMFDVLLWLQRELGAHIYIPITNDETYLVGKSRSLNESRTTALTQVIPSIIALGFDPAKTDIILHTDFPAMHQLATHLSRYTTYNNVRSLFGWDGHENPGVVYYMGGLQFASILMPQLAELGGPKPVLVPVGIDQHPYISLSRDVAKKVNIFPPSELLWKFLPGLKDPTRKMSTSVPGDAIFLNDDPLTVELKIKKSFSGGVPLLRVHEELGAIPEVCSAFQLLTYTLEDQAEWTELYEHYAKGKIQAGEIKLKAVEVINKALAEYRGRFGAALESIDDFLIEGDFESIVSTDDPFAMTEALS